MTGKTLFFQLYTCDFRGTLCTTSQLTHKMGIHPPKWENLNTTSGNSAWLHTQLTSAGSASIIRHISGCVERTINFPNILQCPFEDSSFQQSLINILVCTTAPLIFTRNPKKPKENNTKYNKLTNTCQKYLSAKKKCYMEAAAKLSV